MLIVVQQTMFAQEQKELKKAYKNTIRFNLTNPVIFGSRSIIFGYERVLKNNRSLSINLGQAGLPSIHLISSDSLKTNSNSSEKGFNFSADYRFYLSRENKYAAPRGVYIGPYISYNYFERKNDWLVKSTDGGATQNVSSKTNLSASVVGFEMGYQFVFWNRISLDMILAGPGVAFYNLESSFGSNLSEADKKKLFEKINQALKDKLPGYSIAIDDGEFQKKGNTSSTSFGFRYMVMVGYRF